MADMDDGEDGMGQSTGSPIADDLKNSFSDAVTLKQARNKASDWLNEKAAALKGAYTKATNSLSSSPVEASEKTVSPKITSSTPTQLRKTSMPRKAPTQRKFQTGK